MGFPVFAAGVSPLGGFKTPRGDIVVGDADGVAVVPSALAASYGHPAAYPTSRIGSEFSL